MDYDQAVKLYVELRETNKQLEYETEQRVAENKGKMEKLGAFIQLKAERDKLEKVNTRFGTVFWTVGDRCTIANGEVFFNFVRDEEAWELLEKRASKTGVRDFINTMKKVPPGVDYVTFKQINVRKV
jgi:hypothetical protein